MNRSQNSARFSGQIDREKTCPFLLRVFLKSNTHHPDADFGLNNKLPTKDEHQLYTWKDSSVKEILTLLRDLDPSLRNNPSARYSIRLVFFDPQHEQYNSREIAIVGARELLSPAPDLARGGINRLNKTLDDVRFMVGDFLDVAYITPVPVGSFNNYSDRPRADGPSTANYGGRDDNNQARGNGFVIRGTGGIGGGNFRTERDNNNGGNSAGLAYAPGAWTRGPRLPQNQPNPSTWGRSNDSNPTNGAERGGGGGGGERGPVPRVWGDKSRAPASPPHRRRSSRSRSPHRNAMDTAPEPSTSEAAAPAKESEAADLW